MSIAWDLEAKELLRGGSSLINGVVVLYTGAAQGGGDRGRVVAVAGPNIAVSTVEAECIVERQRKGTLHKDVLRVNER